MKYLNYKKGFTLAETLISLAVIGILTAMLVPSLFNNSPKESGVMLKKAYYTTSRALVELINNNSLYPDEDTGFAYSTPAALCQNFANYVNHTSYTASNCNVAYGGKPGPFMKTQDGMKWYFIASTDNTQNDNQYGYKIIVDINGNKGPNCQLSTLGHCSTGGKFAVGDNHTCVEAKGKGCDHPDTFIISVNRKGKIAGASSYWGPTGTSAQEPYDAKILEEATRLK